MTSHVSNLNLQDDPLTLPERRKGYDLASRPLLPEIRGPRAYHVKLNVASLELYDQLRKEADVKANVGKPVHVNGKPRAALSRFSPRNREVNIAALEHLLHSLSYIASHLSEKLTLIGVPLNQTSYKSTGPYRHLNFRAVRRVVYGLQIFQLGNEPFIDIFPGTHDRTTGIGQVTRVKASGSALDWLTQKGLIFPGHPYSPQQKYDFSFHLQVKVTQESEPKTEKLKENTRREAVATQTKRILDRPLQGTERVLPTSLRLLKKAKLSLPLPNYDFYKRHWDWTNARSKLMETRNARLYRSFSEEDGRGGRIYGHWVQMLPSEARQHLTFHNQPSVELDYSSMQLALLYHIHDIPLPEGELYEIPGTTWPREACKAVLRISVGSSTRTKTIISLANELKNMRLKPNKTEELYDAFWSRHDAVRPHTPGSSAAWIELQTLDAQIALKVLCYLAEQNIPAIPIHDSFIVQARHEAECLEAMKKGFADYAPGIPVIIRSTAENRPT